MGVVAESVVVVGDSATSDSLVDGSRAGRARRLRSKLTGYRRSLGGRITFRLYLIALVPLLLLVAVVAANLLVADEQFESQIPETKELFLDESVAEDRGELSEVILAELEDSIAGALDLAIDWSRSPEVVGPAGLDRDEVEEIVDWPDDLIEDRFGPAELLDSSGASTRYLQEQISDRPEFGEVFFTDANGFNVGATAQTSDFVQRDEEWWQAAWRDGAFIGALEPDASAGIQSVQVAVRIEDRRNGAPLGVLKAVMAASELHDVVDRFLDDDADDRVTIRVISTDGILVADTASEHNAEEVGQPAALQGDSATGFDQALVAEGERGAFVLDENIVAWAKSDEQFLVERLDTQIPGNDWVVLYEIPTEAALLPLSGLDDLNDTLDRSAQVTLGLLAFIVVTTLIVAILVGRLMNRRIIRPINELRDEATKVAEHQMPELVEALMTPGQRIELPEIDPIEIEADGEIGDLTSAFNLMRESAIHLAGDQALGRSKDVANVLVNLGRRNQQLVGRQLQYIDELERTESNPDTLQSLFELDQMATRMRRNAESLLVLAGENTARSNAGPMSAEDVIRSAAAEVEHYTRVRIASVEEAYVVPGVVGDLTHLLAELIENATRFSPPTSSVDVIGLRELDDSYTISIADRGVGIPLEKLAELNARLKEPSFTEGTPSNVLGLFVVGRLAARNGIGVRLVEATTVGTTAKLTIPISCLQFEEAPSPRTTNGNSTTMVATPRHSFETQAAQWPPPHLPPTLETPTDEQDLAAPTRRRAVPPSILGPAEARTPDTPIPPFTARESQRPTSGQQAEASEGLLRIRRRVRSEPPLPGGEHVNLGTSPDEDSLPETPAGEVVLSHAEGARNNLADFTSGVDAARSNDPTSSRVPRQPEPEPEPESSGLVAFTRGAERARKRRPMDDTEEG